MTPEPLLAVEGLTLRFGSVTAFEDVSFEVGEGDLFAVIGPNGAGKTSLFNVLSRVYRETAGTARFAGRDLLSAAPRQLAGFGVARSFQNLGLFRGLTVLENVLVGRHHLLRSGPVRGGLFVGFARREERRHRAVAREALAFFDLLEHADTPVETLPYGVQKRVELARCLAMEPRMVLLDEPVAGMNAGERAHIGQLIRRMHAELGLALLLVEHDMGMVMQVAQRVLVLDFGHVIALGTPAEVQRDDRVIRAYLGEPLEVVA